MGSLNAGSGDDSLQQHTESVDTDDVAGPLAALSFWFAIALPVIYLPLLATGIEGLRGLFLFLALFGLHVIALIGGQSHSRTTGVR